MRESKIVKYLLFIGLSYEISRMALHIIFSFLENSNALNVIDKLSLAPYLPLINMIFIVFIFLDQKKEKEDVMLKKKISSYLQLMNERHRSLSNEHLGGSGSGESVLLALTVRAIVTVEAQNDILKRNISDRDKFIEGYKLFNEWAKYKSLVANYFKIVFLTFKEIYNSRYKEIYLPIFEVYLTEETVKSIACSSTKKIKKDADFYNYLKQIQGSQFERFIAYGEEMDSFMNKLDEIYKNLEEKPDLV